MIHLLSIARLFLRFLNVISLFNIVGFSFLFSSVVLPCFSSECFDIYVNGLSVICQFPSVCLIYNVWFTISFLKYIFRVFLL